MNGAQEILMSHGEYFLPRPSSTVESKVREPRLIRIYPKQYEGINLKIHPRTSPTVFASPPKNLRTKTTIDNNPPTTNVKK